MARLPTAQPGYLLHFGYGPRRSTDIEVSLSYQIATRSRGLCRSLAVQINDPYYRLVTNPAKLDVVVFSLILPAVLSQIRKWATGEVPFRDP